MFEFGSLASIGDLFTWNIFVLWVGLILLEIVLGIDNLIFVAIVASSTHPKHHARTRMIGLSMALAMRVLMLLGVSWLIGLRDPVWNVGAWEYSWRDILMLVGGLFLIIKPGKEFIKEWREVMQASNASQKTSSVHEGEVSKKTLKYLGFGAALIQITLADIAFSFDSILTAVAITDHIGLIISAVVISIIVMYFSASWCQSVITRHPWLKRVALFLIIAIGVMLTLDGGFKIHLTKYTVYGVCFAYGLGEWFMVLWHKRAAKNLA